MTEDREVRLKIVSFSGQKPVDRESIGATCWNDEIVRVAFALYSHDREVISWVATTAGISGEMIRDMMVNCVEQRFGDIRLRARCNG